MNLSTVVSRLITDEVSLPAMKLVWDCQLDANDLDGPLPKMSPSHFLRENMLSTSDRRDLLCKQQKKISCWRRGVDICVEPALIVFQNYNFGDTLRIPITIRNIAAMSQKVVVHLAEHSAFQLDENSEKVAKLASGMVMTPCITFHPESDRDYYHKIIVKTPTVQFVVPIIGIGGRGLLNIPDAINFETVPMGNAVTKIIPVTNIGTAPARFTLTTTEEFSIIPEKGFISPQESLNLKVEHTAAKEGLNEGHILIRFDKGEEIYVYLRAEVVDPKDIKEVIQDTGNDKKCISDDSSELMEAISACCLNEPNSPNIDELLKTDERWNALELV